MCGSSTFAVSAWPTLCLPNIDWLMSERVERCRLLYITLGDHCSSPSAVCGFPAVCGLYGMHDAMWCNGLCYLETLVPRADVMVNSIFCEVTCMHDGTKKGLAASFV